VKVTSCLVLTEAVKQPGLASHHAALRVGEFEVATSGGIWVAIRVKMARTLHVLAFWVCGLLAAGTGLAQSVALSGVAGTRALVTIDAAAPKFLSPGQSHQGVKLLSVQAESAVIEINGQRQTVRVGHVLVRNVEAVVMPQSMPYVLLGNSFLTRFQKQRANDQLTLERRY